MKAGNFVCFQILLGFMGDQATNQCSSSNNASVESTLELNIKTLDSQTYTFKADKNETVSVFKEKIASETGVPVAQQRLIFRGRSNLSGHPPPGNASGGTPATGGQSQAAGQSQPRPAFTSAAFRASMPHVVQIPITAATTIPIPSFQTPIPDSLDTLMEFINRMEQALSRNGYQPDTSSATSEGRPREELPRNRQGPSTPEALAIVLRSSQRLLSGLAVSSLSHIAGRLEQDGSSPDPALRGQIQTEAVQVGLAMQHLGALLLELGRTLLTLRMGQSQGQRDKEHCEDSGHPEVDTISDAKLTKKATPEVVTPLGLGLGGLDRKKRSKQLKTLGKNEDGGTSASVEGVQQGSGTSSQQQLLQSLFSGSSRGRGGANSEGGGGFDLSRMVQQMMPLVSRAFSQGGPSLESALEQADVHQPLQANVQPMMQMIEHSDPPEDVFRAMVENAAMSQEDLADVLCSDEALAHEYAELLRRDLEGRLQDNHGP
ncbi:hypothetical protein F2Q69_00041429 [Brassica cretica]|uniref:Ubiquitin-like domain-containing protein n=1 Tax=Brassica cretica TaxID=69181 RepID=A0A8S9NIH8_BRACR|nr:hypothetical protein F2Q69_00041429 [Brassica cretica]